MGVLEIITTIIGALVGGSGSALQRWLGMRERKAEYEHELALLQLQIRQGDKEHERELEIQETISLANMRSGSYSHDIGGGRASKWVINTLRLVRPLLTVLLIILLWVIWFGLDYQYQEQQELVIRSVLFLAATAITWWFGDRAPRFLSGDK